MTIEQIFYDLGVRLSEIENSDLRSSPWPERHYVDLMGCLERDLNVVPLGKDEDLLEYYTNRVEKLHKSIEKNSPTQVKNILAGEYDKNKVKGEFVLDDTMFYSEVKYYFERLDFVSSIRYPVSSDVDAGGIDYSRFFKLTKPFKSKLDSKEEALLFMYLQTQGMIPEYKNKDAYGTIMMWMFNRRGYTHNGRLVNEVRRDTSTYKTELENLLENFINPLKTRIEADLKKV